MRPLLLVLSALWAAACGYRPSTAIARAAAEGNNTEVRRLLPQSSPAAIDEALVAAARTGNAAAIPDLVMAGARIEHPSGVNGWTPLQHAVHKNQVGSVRALLAAGADPQSAIGMAAGYGQADIVELLLKKGADPRRSVQGANALDLALSGVTDIDRWTRGDCQTETVRALIGHVPDLRPTRSYQRGKCGEIDRLLPARP